MGNDNDFLNDWASAGTDDDTSGVDTGNGGDDAPEVIDTNDAGNQADNGDGSDHAADDASQAAGDDDPDEGQHVPYGAMKAERAKRQEAAARAEKAEARAKELEAQINALRDPAPARAQPAEGTANESAVPSDFWSDPQAFIGQSIAQAVMAERQQAHFRAIEDRQRATHADYNEVAAIAGEAAKRDPELARRILTAQDPGAELYAVGKQIKDYQELTTNPDAYREKLRAELLQELSASDDNAQAQQQAAPRRRTVDLSTRRNAKGDSTAAPPDPFKALFPE